MISKLKRTSHSVAMLTGPTSEGVVTGINDESSGIRMITESTIGANKLAIVLDTAQNKRNGLGFIASLGLSLLYLNGECIGKVFYQKVSNRPQPKMCIEIANSPLIDVYDIGIGDRFLFFYANGVPIGCAHHDNSREFSIFSDDEWYTQIIATYICTELLYGDSKYAVNYITPQDETLEMYDGNYISELLKTEPIEIREYYKHLIHEKKSQEKVVENAKKQSRKSLVGIMFFIFCFFAFAIGMCFAVDYGNYAEVRDAEVYHAVNMDLDGSHFAMQNNKRGLDVKYEKDGVTKEETIYVSKRTYNKYKNVEEFDFRIVRRLDEDSHAYYEYYIGDITFMNTFNFGTPIFLFILFLLFEGLLFIPVVQNAKNKKKLDKV